MSLMISSHAASCAVVVLAWLVVRRRNTETRAEAGRQVLSRRVLSSMLPPVFVVACPLVERGLEKTVDEANNGRCEVTS